MVGRGVVSDNTSVSKKAGAVVIGLSACHFMVSGGAYFEPERVEAELKKESAEEGEVMALELVAEDEEAWKAEKEIADVESGVKRMRLSDFEREEDVWEDIHANQTRHQAIMQDRQAEVVATSYQETLCQQIDKSVGGLKLMVGAGANMQLKAGELLGLRYADKDDRDVWRLASVRWIMSESDGSISFGVRFITDNALPMAARGLAGAGEGGEYIRVLAITETVQNKQQLSLLTPAAVYDLDAEVMLNNGKELRHVRLTHMLETTNSFSRFRFEVVG